MQTSLVEPQPVDRDHSSIQSFSTLARKIVLLNALVRIVQSQQTAESSDSDKDERSRLDRLHQLGLLDTGADDAFDGIATLACAMLDVPIALVSLVDAKRQWFKARVGLESAETDRASSFCAHAIQVPDETLVVEDASRDARFARNPLVTGEPGVRFYAGVPIVTAGGLVPGTLCVIDRKPRSLDVRQEQVLRLLARQVAALIDLHERTRQAKALLDERARLVEESREDQRASKDLLEFVLRGGDVGLWDMDVVQGTCAINDRESEILGYTPDQARDEVTDWRLLVHPEDLPELIRANARHFAGETSFSESTHRLRHREGRYVWVLDRSVAVKRDGLGRPVRIVGTHTDVTARKQLEDEQRQTRQRLDLALSGGDIGLWDRNLLTGQTVYNESWWSLFGFDSTKRQSYEGLWKGLVHPDDYESARVELVRHTAGETSMYVGQVRARHACGEYLWVENRAKVAERDASGAALRIVGITMDVTESKRIQSALAEERRRLALITDSLPALIMRIDSDERYTFINAHFKRVFGHNVGGIVGRTLEEVNTAAVYADIAPHVRLALNGLATSFEAIGSVGGRETHYQSSYVPDVDERGTVNGFFAMTYDITERKRTEKVLMDKQRELDALARTDTLTGLPNRRTIDEHTTQAIARTQRSLIPMAVMYLDIDRFKQINDTRGHGIGDTVLRLFAARLRGCLRDTDLAGRFAGDEFFICLEGVNDVQAVTTVAEKISEAMRAPMLPAGDELHVTTSIGIAVYSGGQSSFATLASLADDALYEAKRAGRGCYRFKT